MKKFIVTFGSGHLGGFGTFFYLEVESQDEITAQERVHELFAGKWSMIYSDVDAWWKSREERAGVEQKLGKLIVYDQYSYDIQSPTWPLA